MWGRKAATLMWCPNTMKLCGYKLITSPFLVKATTLTLSISQMLFPLCPSYLSTHVFRVSLSLNFVLRNCSFVLRAACNHSTLEVSNFRVTLCLTLSSILDCWNISCEEARPQGLEGTCGASRGKVIARVEVCSVAQDEPRAWGCVATCSTGCKDIRLRGSRSLPPPLCCFLCLWARGGSGNVNA